MHLKLHHVAIHKFIDQHLGFKITGSMLTSNIHQLSKWIAPLNNTKSPYSSH